MDFFTNPDVLTSGVGYKGPPADFGELIGSVEEEQRRINNVSARWRYLEEAVDKRNDAIEKAGGPKLFNPLRNPALDPDEQESFRKFVQREGWGSTDGLRHPLRAPSDATFKAAYMLPRYAARLQELAKQHPELAGVIQADRHPMMEVDEAMAAAEKRSGDAWAGRAQAYSWLNPYRVAEGTSAALIGTLWGQRESPVDLLTNFIGPATGLPTKSLMRNMWRSAMANAGVQTALEPGIQAQRAAAGLDAGIGQSIENIAVAGMLGGALDLGIRGPVRAIRSARGAEGLGGVFTDAPETAPDIRPTPTPETVAPDQAIAQAPVSPPPRIDPELVRRATEDGDTGAMRQILDQLPELQEDPALRGAVAQAEIERISPIRIDGIDDGDGLRAFVQSLRAATDPDEPTPRMPDDVPEPRSMPDVERGADLASSPEVAALLRSAGPDLDRAIAGLSRRVEDAIEAGHLDILPIVERAAARMKAAEDEAAVSAAFVKEALTLIEKEGPTRFQAWTDLHGASADPIDIARAIRSHPEIIDTAMPRTDRVEMARSLARLSEDAFERVARGEADPTIAKVVSDHAEPIQHVSLIDALNRAGITDPDAARRSIPDLLPFPEREPGSMPLDGGWKIDDPHGPQAKAQVETLRAEYAPEMAEHKANLEARKQQAEQARQAEIVRDAIIARADEVRAAVREVTGMVPSDIEVKVFTSAGDLPAHVAVQVMRANAKAFGEALQAFGRAASDDERLAARQQMDAAKSGLAVEALAADDVIWIGAHALDPQGRVAHELIHALVRTGRLTPDEMRLLAKVSRDAGVFGPDREALYLKTYQGRGRLSELLDEEAAAHLMEAWRAGRPEMEAKAPEVARQAAQAQGIIARVQAFLASVREALGRVLGKVDQEPTPAGNPVADLLDAILSGEVAKRERIASVLQAEDISAVAVRPEMMAAFRDRIEPALPRPNSDVMQDVLDETRRIAFAADPRAVGYDLARHRNRTAGHGGTGPGRDPDGSASPVQDRGAASAGIRSPQGAVLGTHAQLPRLEVTTALRSLIYEAAAAELNPARASERATQQGFTIQAWHGTLSDFDVPDPFIQGRDFGFHFAIGKPDAANERIGYPATLMAKLRAFIAKLLGEPEQRPTHSAIMPLLVKASNPLRLPDMGLWSHPYSWRNTLRDEADLIDPPGWVAPWVDQWIADNGAQTNANAASASNLHTFSRDIAAEIERRGYDSIVYRNRVEAKGQDSMLLWDMRRVRSALDMFDERAADDAGLRASDPYIEAGIREIANASLEAQGIRSRSNVMFAFAGEKAKTADHIALRKAVEMEGEGNPREDIWRETGWFRGVDGKWRFEIDDSGGIIKGPRPEPRTYAQGRSNGGSHVLAETADNMSPSDVARQVADALGFAGDARLSTSRTSWGESSYLRTPLGDIRISDHGVGHNRLISEAAGYDYKIGPKAIADDLLKRLNAFDVRASDARAKADSDATQATWRRTAQEAIKSAKDQWWSEKGFGNATETSRKKAWKSGLRDQWTEPDLRNLWSEVEARAVQKRMDMTADERRARPPWLDYDVPEDQQIVRFADGANVSQLSYGEPPPIEGHPTIRGQALFAIRAGHVSRHDFDRFDWNKIGGGEGGQWFSYGHYFASSEKTLDVYERQFTRHRLLFDGVEFGDSELEFKTKTGVPTDQRRVMDFDATTLAEKMRSREESLHKALAAEPESKALPKASSLTEYVYTIISSFVGWRDLTEPMKHYASLAETTADRDHLIAPAVAILNRWIDNGRIKAEEVKPTRYHVELDVDEGRLLHLDAALADQPPMVRKALEAVIGKRAVTGQSFLGRMLGLKPNSAPDGYGLIQSMIDRNQNAWLTEMLKKEGVQGVKYRNGVTRGRFGESDPEAFNYVIFDDDLIKIVAKNGEPVEPAEKAALVESMSANQSRDDGPLFAFSGEQIDEMPKPRKRYILEGGPEVYAPPEISTLTQYMKEQVNIALNYVMDVRGGLRPDDDGIRASLREAKREAGGAWRDAQAGARAMRGKNIDDASQVTDDADVSGRVDFYYAIYDEDGNEVGDAFGFVEGNRMYFDWLGGDERDANKFGIRVIKDLREQVRKDFPEVTEFAGFRASGARAKNDAANREQSVRFALAGDDDHVARLTGRITDLAARAGQDVPDGLQPRIAAALDALSTLQEAAAARGIDVNGDGVVNVVDLAQANAGRAMAQITDLLGPERTAAIANDLQTLTRDLPTDPQEIAARLNDILDQYFPQEQPKVPANDNVDLGPVSPVERDLYDIERIGAIMELIGACR